MRPEKHSLTLKGHRTSVSLESEFWAAFRDLAARRGLGINALAAEIDIARGDQGLASAIRVAVLNDLLEQISNDEPPAPAPPAHLSKNIPQG
ncbi:ribbon-helix-helix domain-containing protein [Pararhodobacter oceanensis]|uniref:ribbon-helix-helix domain-containing protein n=1 Tax=Pararhodobacter oceanensis TaxID=2172121 RepID=UPI003A8F1C2E